MEESPEFKSYDNIGDFSKNLFNITAMTPRGTLEVRCIHITQLMIHQQFKHYHLPCFMLQASLHTAEGK